MIHTEVSEINETDSPTEADGNEAWQVFTEEYILNVVKEQEWADKAGESSQGDNSFSPISFLKDK